MNFFKNQKVNFKCWHYEAALLSARGMGPRVNFIFGGVNLGVNCGVIFFRNFVNPPRPLASERVDAQYPSLTSKLPSPYPLPPPRLGPLFAGRNDLPPVLAPQYKITKLTKLG